MGSSDVSFLLKEKVLAWGLIFKVEGTFVFLFASLGIFRRLSSSFRRECLDLEGLSLRERRFI